MDSVFEPEKIIVLVPIIAIGTTLFNYIINTLRNETLEFKLKEFLYVLGGSFLYAIGLGIFTFYFYKIVVERFYNPIKGFILRPKPEIVE